MTFLPRRFALLTLTLAAVAPALPAGAGPPGDRPCGPASMTGPLRWLIPQGFGRVDFKLACRTHDLGYGTLGSDRSRCDTQFRADMVAACDGSRTPRLCRLTAHVMAASVRRFGAGAHQAAQAKAARR